MIILSFTIVQAFVSKHPESAESLNRWYKITRGASWKEFSDIKRDFGSVDAVGNDRYVFNIRGNVFRLEALIHFNKRTLYIRYIGTHANYDKTNCSTI